MKNSKIQVIALIVAALLISSCGGINKMKKEYGEVDYKVTPSPLEMHGGQVAVSVKGNFPEGYFQKEAIVDLTPVLKYEGGETELESVTLQGEEVEANNKVIPNDAGGNFSYSDTVEYKEDMFRSELVLQGKGYLQDAKDEKVAFDSLKIADGIIATADLVKNNPQAIMESDQFQRVETETIKADIHYLIERSNLRRSELSKEDITQLDSMVKEIAEKEDISFKQAQIAAYASPDGPVDLNEELSNGRKESAYNYLEDKIKNAQIDTDKETAYKHKVTTEDWEGFKKVVQNSDIEDKDLILRVLSMHSDPEVREKELENMAATWEVLAEKILPQLRRSELNVDIEKVGFSDKEIKKYAQSNPDTLNLEELLYATTLTDDNDTMAGILKSAVNQYPDSYRANNNLGCIHYNKGNLQKAKSHFQKAKKIKDTDEVNNNLGAIALKNGKLDNAEELLVASQGAGDIVNYNLGIVNIKKGNYAEAVNYFGNVCKMNAGLAKLLKGNTDEAMKNLDCIEEPEAKAYYLKAVLGARTNKDEMVYSNLRNAFGKDPSLKERAKKDLEFAEYMETEDETFMSIIE